MTDQTAALDEIDRAILGALVSDGRISWRDLGASVSLSPNATAERVRRLERLGAITGYQAVIDPVTLGRPLEAIVGVKMHPGDDRTRFEHYVRSNVAVVDAVHLTGPHDYIVHFRCRDTGELDDVLMHVKRAVGVADTETRVVLRRLTREQTGGGFEPSPAAQAPKDGSIRSRV